MNKTSNLLFLLALFSCSTEYEPNAFVEAVEKTNTKYWKAEYSGMGYDGSWDYWSEEASDIVFATVVYDFEDGRRILNNYHYKDNPIRVNTPPKYKDIDKGDLDEVKLIEVTEYQLHYTKKGEMKSTLVSAEKYKRLKEMLRQSVQVTWYGRVIFKPE